MKFKKGDHRKAYKYYYGEIPKDVNGVTYDIHHIDGNNSNNSKENLVALSLQEHFDEHYSRGEYSSAALIAIRMGKDGRFLEDLAQKRVESGEHNFLKENRKGRIGNEFTRESIKEYVKTWIAEGRHTSVKGSDAYNKRMKTMYTRDENGLTPAAKGGKKCSATKKALFEREIVNKIKAKGYTKIKKGWWHGTTEELEELYELM